MIAVAIAALLSGVGAAVVDVRRRVLLLRKRGQLLAQTANPRLRNQIRAQYRAELAVYLATTPNALLLGVGGRGRLALDPAYAPPRRR